MSRFDLDEMNDLQFDILKELGNIGAGNATTALAQMLNTKIDIKVPKVELIGFNKLGEAICGEEDLVVGIYLFLQGDISGSMMYMLDMASAKQLIYYMMGKNMGEGEEFGEMELSALTEIGNIIVGSYLNSLSSLTNLTISSSIPYLSIDMASAILSVPAIEFGKVSDKVLFIQTQFSDEMMINGFFLLIPELNSYDKILSSLGM